MLKSQPAVTHFTFSNTLNLIAGEENHVDTLKTLLSFLKLSINNNNNNKGKLGLQNFRIFFFFY